MTILYAWATDAWFNGNFVDHTWVTTYDNTKTAYETIADVQDAGEHYWYCWGDFHATGEGQDSGDGALGNAQGDLAISMCIALPDVATKLDRRAQGTIYRYGIDGVCHQLCNQVLVTTARFPPNLLAPLTVSNARGYWLSTFMYGSYGVDQVAWHAKLASCEPQGTAMAAPIPPNDAGDEFQRRAEQVLADDPPTLSELLELRRAALLASAHPDAEALRSAESINARNQEFFDRAAKLLGPERYRELFGVEAGQNVRLVDPTMFRNEREGRS